MPKRKSQNNAPSSSSTPLKRTLSQYKLTPPSRQSKRIKSSPVDAVNGTTMPKKSLYAEHSTSESEAESDIQKEESGYEDEDESASLVSSPPESDVEDDEEDEEDYASEDVAPKKRKRAVKKTAVSNSSSTPAGAAGKGQELWRPGVKSSLEPGQAIFIKLPKARPAGSTPYAPTTIHPNTFLFLSDLRANNDREWLKVHDADYRQSQADWVSFVESLTEKIIEKDDTIPELPPKDLTFRIYRDIRFSPDPTPYKVHFSAAWSRTGRKGPYAGYYVQIQPGNASFVGAGMWHPEAAPVAAMRRDLDRRSHRLKEVLMGADLRKEFLGGVAKEDGKVVGKFVSMNGEGALKTKPKGYDADNANITLLRLRNYTIGKKLKDEEVLGPKALKRIADLIGILTPFVSYLNSVVMPDDPASSDDDDEEEEEEEEEGGEEEEGDVEEDDGSE